MKCAEAELLLSRRLDGEPLASDAPLDDHLRGCPACRARRDRWVRDEAMLAELWPPVAASPDFAERLTARLPERRQGWGRRLALVAAIVLVLLAGGLLVQPTARAAVGLFLRQVVLRESVEPPESLGLRSMSPVSLEEAQRLVNWPIWQPASLPDGYRLVGVYAGELHAFAAGPTIVLHYQQGEGSAARHLGITELRATADLDEPIEPGAAHQIPVGAGTGLFIEGLWVEQNGQRTWERGTLARLIVEQADLVIQLQGDPRDGWDAASLAEVAAGIHE